MKLFKHIELIGSILILAAIGCGARPSKPVPTFTADSNSSTSSNSSDSEAGATANTTGNKTSDAPESSKAQSPAGADAPSQPTPNPAGSAPPIQPSTVQKSKQPVAPPEPPPEPIVPVRDDVSSEPWVNGDQLPLEYWEVQYYNAQRIGVTHYKVQATAEHIAVRMETNMQIQRGGQAIRQKIVIETRERPNGHVDQFTETIIAGTPASKMLGPVKDGKLLLQKEGADRNSRKEIDWSEGSWGPLGIHQILLRKPMQAGEVRQAEVFMPQTHKMALVTLVAGKPESTTTLNGLLADVVPIEAIMQFEKDGIRVRMWMDSAGRVQKTIWPEGYNVSTFRITGDVAQRLQAEDEIVANMQATIACEKLSIDPTQAEKVLYSIHSESADPSKLFAPATNQMAKTKLVYDALVTVVRPGWEGAVDVDTEQVAPGKAELESSALLGSASPQVDRLAKQWSDSATEPVAIARDLLQATHKHLRKTEFTSTIQTAEQVAQSLEGDCTEHAMLLAALLRNRQIPARIASGVRLRDKKKNAVPAKVVEPKDSSATDTPKSESAESTETREFEYHMWTEAWLKDKWVPMDATTGELTSCAYLKFVDTSLAEGDAFGPVLTVLKRLKELRVMDSIVN